MTVRVMIFKRFERFWHLRVAFGDIEVITYGVQEHSYQGDSNRFRDQGQILIHSNIISNSSGFGGHNVSIAVRRYGG